MAPIEMIIVGGGYGGLTTAIRLTKKKCKVRMFKSLKQLPIRVSPSLSIPSEPRPPSPLITSFLPTSAEQQLTISRRRDPVWLQLYPYHIKLGGRPC